MDKAASKIGPIDTLILFGCGRLIVELAKESSRRGIKTYIFAVKRHLDELIDGKEIMTLKEALRREEIPFFNVADINNSRELAGVISGKTMGLGYGLTYTFQRETLKLFKNRIFDFMIIDLPKFRGGAHFTWQILQNNRVGSWNIQVINEEMIPGVYDSGEILKTKRYKIPLAARTPQDYFNISDVQGLRLFKEFLNEVQRGKEFKLSKIQEKTSSYFPRLYTLRHGFINWSWGAREIEKFVCAFDDPYPGASTFINGKTVFFKKCFIRKSRDKFHPFMSGLIYRIQKKSVFAATKDATLIIHRVLDQKGNDVSPGLKLGERFYTPMKYLENAMLFNAEYDIAGLVKKGKK